MTKKYIINQEMSDPDWIQKKQQDYFNLKHAFERFEWGSAFILSRVAMQCGLSAQKLHEWMSP